MSTFKKQEMRGSDDDSRARTMEEEKKPLQSIYRCVRNEIMAKNEFSCFFLNSGGQHLIHIAAYLLLKLLLSLSVAIMSNKTKLTLQQQHEKEKNQQQEKNDQNNQTIDATSEVSKPGLKNRLIYFIFKSNLKTGTAFFYYVF